MIGARHKISGPGRKPKLTVIPVMNMFRDPNDFLEYLVEIFKFTPTQAMEHIALAKRDTVYVTQFARCPCDYQVIVDSVTAPNRSDVGIAHMKVRRIDGKPGPFEWEDLQEIKEAVFGKEIEAMELYPRRSRALKDNMFRHLWVLTNGEDVPVGFHPQGTGSN